MSPQDFETGTAGYAQRTLRHVPGLEDMHRMAGLLLAEHVPDRGRVLVLGAGGGMELRALTAAHPGWRFDGVDPSAPMLDEARGAVADKADRVTLHHGHVEDAPAGPFDGATCLLVLHFLPRQERLQTLRDLAKRLRPGAPLVVVHHSVPAGAEGDLWLRRHAAYLASGGLPRERTEAGAATMRARLPLLSPPEEEALLAEAGFTGVQLFYAAFTFRGWVGYRA